jgi:hypothetical protein
MEMTCGEDAWSRGMAAQDDVFRRTRRFEELK